MKSSMSEAEDRARRGNRAAAGPAGPQVWSLALPMMRLNQHAGERRGQPQDGNLVGPRAQVLIDGAHVRHLQAPAELDAQEAEAHVPYLPEAALRLAEMRDHLASARRLHACASNGQAVSCLYVYSWLVLSVRACLEDAGPKSYSAKQTEWLRVQAWRSGSSISFQFPASASTVPAKGRVRKIDRDQKFFRCPNGAG